MIVKERERENENKETKKKEIIFKIRESIKCPDFGSTYNRKQKEKDQDQNDWKTR